MVIITQGVSRIVAPLFSSRYKIVGVLESSPRESVSKLKTGKVLALPNRRRCEVKSYDELKAEMEAIQQQMVEAKKYERANALKEVKRLCKEFGYTAGNLKGSLAKGRGNQ